MNKGLKLEAVLSAAYYTRYISILYAIYLGHALNTGVTAGRGASTNTKRGLLAQ